MTPLAGIVLLLFAIAVYSMADIVAGYLLER